MTTARERVLNADAEALAALSLPWTQWDGSRVLVTGAAGQIGGYCLEMLKRVCALHGVRADIVGLSRSGRAGKHWIVQDVSIPIDRKQSGEFTHILHAASQATPAVYKTDPVGTALPNSIGTFHLLEHLRAQGPGAASFLFVSSGEVYGVNRDSGPVKCREDVPGLVDCAKVRSCYGESKRFGETLCVGYSAQFGVRTVMARTFHTYGPGMKLGDGRIFSDLMQNLVRREPLTLKSDGRAVRAYAYVRDTVAGYFTMWLKGESGVPYNVGNEDQTLSILELAEALAREFSAEGARVERLGKQDNANYLESPMSYHVPDTTRLRSLGWKPKVAVGEGFRRTLESLG